MPSLKDRQISKLGEFPRWLGEVRTTKTDGLGFFLRPQYGSGAILLRNLDDATKFQSVEFAGISIDELTKNPELIFDTLRGSLRWPGISDPFFVGATNPNGRYFKWVRQLWVERFFPDHLKPIADEFAYVKALPADNPYLDESYWQMLNTLTRRLRDAWRDGDWYVAVQGLVYDDFTEDNITEDEPDLDRPFELGIDDGYIDARAVLFIQRQPSQVLVFDELYQTKRLEEETIRAILRKSFETTVRLKWTSEGRRGIGERKSPLQEDDWPDETGKMGLAELAVTLRKLGVPLPELAAVSHEAAALRRRLRQADIPARNWLIKKAGGRRSTRLAAIDEVRALVRDGKGQRPLQVNRRCRNLLDEVMSGYRLKEGPDGYEDKPEDGNDHAANALEFWTWLRGRRL